MYTKAGKRCQTRDPRPTTRTLLTTQAMAKSDTVEVSNYVSADTASFRESGKVPEIEWHARHEWKTCFCQAPDIQQERTAGNSATLRPHY